MEDKKILLDNIDKIHTTEMGVDRIRRNLKIDTVDVVEYCKNKVLDKNCNIYKQGKNWYCEVENIKITINSYSYTIITAHIVLYTDEQKDLPINHAAVTLPLSAANVFLHTE